MNEENQQQKKAEVGYMRPPKDKQFKPGCSGNRSGRPKGRKNTYTLLDEILSQQIILKENGKETKISQRSAMLMQLVRSGVKGDIKAIGILFPHLLNADIKAEEREKSAAGLGKDDLQIIQLHIAKLMKEQEYDRKSE